MADFPTAYVAASVADAIRHRYGEQGLCPKNDVDGYPADVNVVSCGSKVIIQIGDETFSATFSKESST
jgi:hypothetical protein